MDPPELLSKKPCIHIEITKNRPFLVKFSCRNIKFHYNNLLNIPWLCEQRECSWPVTGMVLGKDIERWISAYLSQRDIVHASSQKFVKWWMNCSAIAGLVASVLSMYLSWQIRVFLSEGEQKTTPKNFQKNPVSNATCIDRDAEI